jgi:hypothetical protein
MTDFRCDGPADPVEMDRWTPWLQLYWLVEGRWWLAACVVVCLWVEVGGWRLEMTRLLSGLELALCGQVTRDRTLYYTQRVVEDYSLVRVVRSSYFTSSASPPTSARVSSRVTLGWLADGGVGPTGLLQAACRVVVAVVR